MNAHPRVSDDTIHRLSMPEKEMSEGGCSTYQRERNAWQRYEHTADIHCPTDLV